MCLFVQDGGGALAAILSFLKTSIPRGDKAYVLTWAVSNFCDPKDGSLPGSSAHGISQARILDWGAILSSFRSL